MSETWFCLCICLENNRFVMLFHSTVNVHDSSSLDWRIWWVLLEEDLDPGPLTSFLFVERLKCGDAFNKASSPRPHGQTHWVAVVRLDDCPLMVILPPHAPLFISFLKPRVAQILPLNPYGGLCALLCRWRLNAIHKWGNNSIITSLTLEKWKKERLGCTLSS